MRPDDYPIDEEGYRALLIEINKRKPEDKIVPVSRKFRKLKLIS